MTNNRLSNGEKYNVKENTNIFEFNVGGMTCTGCALAVEYALSTLEGVQTVSVNYLQNGLTRVEAQEDAVTLTDIESALNEHGYHIVSHDAKTTVEEPPQAGQKTNRTTVLLIGLMTIGLAAIVYIFSNNPQSLPIDVGNNAPDEAVGVFTLEVADVGVEDVSSASSDSLSFQPCCPLVSQQTSSEEGFQFYPDLDETATYSGAIPIPSAESQVTVYLAGLSWCSTCAAEAQHLSRLMHEYDDTSVLNVVFIDIYNYGGPDALADFAQVLEATNLTWAIDTEGKFKESYQVDVDSTIIMNQKGKILYRDDKVTSYETLRREIDNALSS